MKLIPFSLLREMAEAKLIFELVAERRPNGQGYMLIARTRKGDHVLTATRSPGPRHFKSLDTLINETDKLGIRNVTVVSFDPRLVSLRRSTP